MTELKSNEIVIRNIFDENKYTGYEASNLIEYTEIISKLKADIVTDINERYGLFDNIASKLKGSNSLTNNIRGVWENDKGDYCFYALYVSTKFNEKHEEEGKYLEMRIIEMQIGSSENSALETSNVYGFDEEIGFTQY